MGSVPKQTKQIPNISITLFITWHLSIHDGCDTQCWVCYNSSSSINRMCLFVLVLECCECQALSDSSEWRTLKKFELDFSALNCFHLHQVSTVGKCVENLSFHRISHFSISFSVSSDTVSFIPNIFPSSFSVHYNTSRMFVTSFFHIFDSRNFSCGSRNVLCVFVHSVMWQLSFPSLPHR